MSFDSLKYVEDPRLYRSTPSPGARIHQIPRNLPNNLFEQNGTTSKVFRPISSHIHTSIDAMVANGASPVIKFESSLPATPAKSTQSFLSSPNFKAENQVDPSPGDSAKPFGASLIISKAAEHSFTAFYGKFSQNVDEAR
jgi:hypothetical protein